MCVCGEMTLSIKKEMNEVEEQAEEGKLGKLFIEMRYKLFN